jgi:hypothetical protein
MNQTITRAAIKRATLAAQRDMNTLDAHALKQLKALYQQAAADIRNRIGIHAGADDNLSLQELQSLLAQVNGKLNALAEARDALLDGQLSEAAGLGVRPFAAAGESVITSAAAMRINEDAVRFVRGFIAEDGLQLSDRIWRLDRHAREAVTSAIEQAVIQGHGAVQAAREFLARGEAVPGDVAAKMNAANAGRIGASAASALTGSGSPMDNAMRLFRTELNRAHIDAYRTGASHHPDAVGTRFKLSPAHPQHDICDLHAAANLYGLGPGVYPFGKSPLPAHPNTLSYEEVVFKDEVSEADKAGKESPMQALARLTPEQQRGVLGANKHEAYKEGKLSQGMIRSKWSSVQRRIGG